MLVLVRHGESTANAAGLLLGRIDAPLTERGLAQAAAVGPLLGAVRSLVSSPLRRALDTAVALHTGVDVAVDERWIEVDYGVFDGQALRDVPADVWREWRADPPTGRRGARPSPRRRRASARPARNSSPPTAQGRGARTATWWW